MAKTVTKYFSWSWDELPSEEGAAFAESWRYNDDGGLTDRTRIPLQKKPTGHTISTDPRAGQIMREELGLARRQEQPMGGPHH